jgi:poly(3-hydroxybutyrate) depolymerase
MLGRSATAVAALFLAGALALCCVGCRCSKKDAAPAASASATGPVILAPLSEPSWLVDLPVPGHAPAKVAVPLGSVRPAPVVIALHGSFDRPEWQCGHWASITGGRPFVLCPSGIAREGRFSWGAPESTAKELRAALTALKQRYGAHVAPGSVVLAGYGLGADHAIWIQKQEPGFFSHMALVEGGTEKWSSTMAAAFAQRGGKRILYACAHEACVPNAQRARLFSVGAGLDVKSVTVVDEQRAFSPKVVRALKKEWPWLAAGGKRP